MEPVSVQILSGREMNTMPLLFVFIYTSLAIFLTISLFNMLAGPFLKHSPPQDEISSPFISVLVPARNEEKNIGACLDSLLQQDYQNYEILVLDDESDDRTSEIVSRYAEIDSRVHLIQGKKLPGGWTGKNWACHQLTRNARGEIFLFTDADNRHDAGAIKHSVAWMNKYRLGMLSAFPQQLTGTFTERLVVPIIDMLVYGSLILWLTYYSRFTSLSAANGQWLMISRKSYNTTGGHEAVRQEVVEDVHLIRLAKRMDIPVMTLAGTGMVYGRMYHNAGEVWNGFTKNLFGLVSNRSIPFFAIIAGLYFTYVLPYGLLFIEDLALYSLAAVILNVMFRFLLSIRYRHNVLISTVLHPFSIIAMSLIGINSFMKTRFGMIEWKKRKIKITK